jgi:hypothetical protein
LIAPYRVQSSVSLSIFREFLSALEGNAINITDTNLTELDRLCKEFHFSELAVKLSKFRPSMSFKEGESEDANARGRIAVLEEKVQHWEDEIAILQDKVTQLSTDFWRLVGEVSALRSASAGIQTLWEEVSALKTHIGQKLNDPIVEQLSMNFRELRTEDLIQKAEIAAMSLTVTPSQNQPPSPSPAVSLPITSTPSQKQALPPSPTASQSVPNQPPPPSPAPSRPSPQPPVPSFDSRIISDLPEIFAEFRKNQISLLWRGSRDGFEAQEFHRRCDGHANTLTVILDTEGNIFGGFTPVEWESLVWNGTYFININTFKADDSLKSFVFTLKNPHNFPERRFALKAEKKDRAILCNSEYGPAFGGDGGVIVYGNCNANTDNCTLLGPTYINDTGLNNDIVFTGSLEFRVTEIEVFEITV